MRKRKNKKIIWLMLITGLVFQPVLTGRVDAALGKKTPPPPSLKVEDCIKPENVQAFVTQCHTKANNIIDAWDKTAKDWKANHPGEEMSDEMKKDYADKQKKLKELEEECNLCPTLPTAQVADKPAEKPKKKKLCEEKEETVSIELPGIGENVNYWNKYANVKGASIGTVQQNLNQTIAQNEKKKEIFGGSAVKFYKDKTIEAYVGNVKVGFLKEEKGKWYLIIDCEAAKKAMKKEEEEYEKSKLAEFNFKGKKFLFRDKKNYFTIDGAPFTINTLTTNPKAKTGSPQDKNPVTFTRVTKDGNKLVLEGTYYYTSSKIDLTDKSGTSSVTKTATVKITIPDSQLEELMKNGSLKGTSAELIGSVSYEISKSN